MRSVVPYALVSLLVIAVETIGGGEEPIGGAPGVYVAAIIAFAILGVGLLRWEQRDWERRSRGR